MAEKTDELTAKTRVPSSGPAADLLGRVIDHLLRTRDVNISLRQLAADIGTSHRILLYHFGSRVELMVTVLLALNERDSLQVSGARTCAEFLRKWWRMYRTSAGQFNFSLYFAANGCRHASRYSQRRHARW